MNITLTFPPPLPPKKNSYFDRDGVHFKNTMTINALFTRIQTVLKPHICFRIRVDSGP